MSKKLVLVMAAVGALAACGDKQAAQTAPPPPPFPTFTVSEILNMNKNQRDELERRCLGLQNTTCDNLKSKSFKDQFDLKVSLCKSSAAFEGLTSASKAAEKRRACDAL